MKFSALHQSYMNRRSNSFRNSSSPLDSSPDAGMIKSPAALFWLILHGFCCLISLVLGLRFSRLVFFLLFSTSVNNDDSNNQYLIPPLFTTTTEFTQNLPFHFSNNNGDSVPVSNASGNVASRVVVGRHGIRIRPWPHPDPVEVMKAHRIIEIVQNEQRLQHGVKNPRTVIAVTPTYLRTFQTLHLTGVMHSLMNVPYHVIWIVVEAGGATNETFSLISSSGLRIIHVGLDQAMGTTWEERHQMEVRMRVRALRIVREQKLDGIVMFADDSNMHSMELFDEIQNVKWIGAVSIGILAHSGSIEESSAQQKVDEENASMPIQGPACNSSKKLVGWHTFNSLPYTSKRAIDIDDRATVLLRKLEWAGFVMSSRLIWKDVEDKPDWVKDLDTIDEDIDSPLSLLNEASEVEPLEECGRKVMIWWLRVEARVDSEFPSGWIINPPLEITVPSKRTPWPDTPPELPITSTESVIDKFQKEHIEKRPTKTRPSRPKRSSRSKRKREPRVTANTQVSSRHPEEK